MSVSIDKRQTKNTVAMAFSTAFINMGFMLQNKPTTCKQKR